MDAFKRFFPTIIRAGIFNVVFSMFKGRNGKIALVVLLAAYFILSQFGIITI